MSEGIFRKKSLDKIKSPENLDDYIRVSNPGVWLILISVILLLAGACVWGIFGRIDSTEDITVRAENGVITATVADVDVTEEMVIRVAGTECNPTEILFDPSTDRHICTVTAKADVPDGVYDAVLVTGEVKPLSFVLN